MLAPTDLVSRTPAAKRDFLRSIGSDISTGRIAGNLTKHRHKSRCTAVFERFRNISDCLSKCETGNSLGYAQLQSPCAESQARFRLESSRQRPAAETESLSPDVKRLIVRRFIHQMFANRQELPVLWKRTFADVGGERSVGSVGDLSDNALPGTINGFYNARVVDQL
jgi:hypothetical protein